MFTGSVLKGCRKKERESFCWQETGGKLEVVVAAGEKEKEREREKEREKGKTFLLHLGEKERNRKRANFWDGVSFFLPPALL